MNIAMYREFAEAHDGRALYTLPMRFDTKSMNDTVDNIVMLDPSSKYCLVGRLVQAGSDYRPEDWSADSDFLAPDPWCRGPARTWLALEDVRVVRISTDDYVARSGRTLTDMLGDSRSPYFFVENTLES